MTEWEEIQDLFATTEANDKYTKYKRCTDYLVQFNANYPGTITNEKRSMHTEIKKYRANQLCVTRILHVPTKKWMNHIYHYVVVDGVEVSILYKVDCVARPNGWNPNLDILCGQGIHFFNTLEEAYQYKPIIIRK